MVFSIEKFASVLCLVHGTNQVRDQLPPECFVMTDHSEEVHIVIQKLFLQFNPVLIPLVQRLTDTERLKGIYLFAKHNLACYVNMSEDPSYLKFLLLCSLVKTIVSEMFLSQHCYSVAKILSICLIAVYYRCYNGLFKEKEESESLGSYCEDLYYRFLNVVQIRYLPISLKLQTREMLLNLQNADFENFSLKNSEKEMLLDALDFVAPEGNLPEDEVTSTTPCENNSSSVSATLPRNIPLDLSAVQFNLPEDAVTTTTPYKNISFLAGASNVEDAMEDLNSSEALDYSSEESKICVTCNRRCFKYLEAFHREVVEESILHND